MACSWYQQFNLILDANRMPNFSRLNVWCIFIENLLTSFFHLNAEVLFWQNFRKQKSRSLQWKSLCDFKLWTKLRINYYFLKNILRSSTNGLNLLYMVNNFLLMLLDGVVESFRTLPRFEFLGDGRRKKKIHFKTQNGKIFSKVIR